MLQPHRIISLWGVPSSKFPFPPSCTLLELLQDWVWCSRRCPGPHPRSQPWSCLWECSMQASLLKNEAPCWMLLEWSVCCLPTSSPPLPCPMLDSSALNWPGEGKYWRLASISSQLPILSKQMAEVRNPAGWVGKGKGYVCWKGCTGQVGSVSEQRGDQQGAASCVDLAPVELPDLCLPDLPSCCGLNSAQLIENSQTELKNPVTEVKDTPEGANSRLGHSNKGISELEDRVSGSHWSWTGKGIFKNEDSLRDL